MSSTATHQPLSHAVVETVAVAEGVDPLDLEVRLYDAIDPDALDALFATTNDGHSRTGTMTFEYCGHTVVVTSDRTVTLADEPAAPEDPA